MNGEKYLLNLLEWHKLCKTGALLNWIDYMSNNMISVRVEYNAQRKNPNGSIQID